jgi:hypothetical protein
MREIRLSPESGGFRPTARQELLLRAALLPTAEAGAAWSEWAAGPAMDNLDEGSYRLLPLVYRNLKAQRIQHRLMGTLKGLYRRAWCENQLLFHRTVGVLESLRKAGIPTLLLKGAALALEYYKDLGARPMSDLDFWCRRRSRGCLHPAGSGRLAADHSGPGEVDGEFPSGSPRARAGTRSRR